MQEEQKQTHHREPTATAFWQWQSGVDPDLWKEKDPAKWTWQNYSDSDCLVIEQAFSLNQEIADLKDYEVDLKRMLQVNKNFRNRVRRVRRQERSRFMLELSQPVAFSSSQKTMNEAFGTIQHFLDYVMKRTPEAYALYQRLKGYDLDCQARTVQDIIDAVIVCIEKGAEIREKVIKTRSGSHKDFATEAKTLVELVKKASTNLRNFLRAVLKIYTMETFICYWLNELLRSEDWEDINVLTPYLVCLVYTFKLSDYIMKYEEPKPPGFMDSFLGIFNKKEQKKLYLYRGTALAKEHLELYDVKKVQFFSWNGVTSTSKERNVALEFIRLSLRKAQNEPKVGVLFQIETDFASSEDCEGMIDISPDSQFPEEKEIILAPGTVFGLQKIRLVEESIYEVNLKIIKKLQEIKVNDTLIGVLQDQTISGDQATISSLPSQQIFKVLGLLKGNQMIQKLHIKDSVIEEYIIEEIENIRVTTKVKREDVNLVNNTINVNSLNFLQYLPAETLALNKVLFSKEERVNQSSIKTLEISEEGFEEICLHNGLEKVVEKIKNESQITTLNFTLKRPQAYSEKYLHLLECIRELKSLQNLQLTLHLSSAENFKALCQTIKPLKKLTQLSFEFNLSGEELFFMKEEQVSLKSLRHLVLDFQQTDKATNKGLDHLGNGLTSLTALEQLVINLGHCKNISNEGLKSLSSGLSSLISLQNLSLDFRSCKAISDEGLDYLGNGMTCLTALQFLNINLRECSEISNEGLGSLKQGLQNLTSLERLSLDFASCCKVSSQGLYHLGKGLKPLVSLRLLSLDFDSCNLIADEGLYHLCGALISLKLLQHLTLIFSKTRELSSGGIKNCEKRGHKYEYHRHPPVNLSEYGKISDEGLNHLKQSLMSLTSLEFLSLYFSFCPEISDQGLFHLQHGLMPLLSLKDLRLRFEGYLGITEEGLNNLIQSLTSLQSLQTFALLFCLCWFRYPHKLLRDMRGPDSLKNFYLKCQYCSCLLGNEGRSLHFFVRYVNNC